MLKGIDVSKHQGTIDWNKVKAAGIEFAMLRAGYGNHIDEQFQRNLSECNRLKISCGVYWFSYALNYDQAVLEAKQCIAAIKPYKIDYPVCYDLEYDTVRYAKEHGVTINRTLATAFTAAFCAEIQKAGYTAMFYANQDYMKNMFDLAALKEYPLWYAWYNAKCNRTDAVLWQYTSSGKVDGINGNVDLNYLMKEALTLAELTAEQAKQIVKEKAELDDKTIDYLANDYKYGKDLIVKLAKAMQ